MKGRALTSYSQKPGGGFTMVELLVVIVVIGLLVGLAVPGLQKALNAAANTQDMSNLRQIGVAISIFEAENEGRIPNTTIPLPGNGNANFMEAADRMMPPDSKFNSNSQYNYTRRPVWYSKRYAQMPAGQTYAAASNYYWGLAWGMNTFLWYNNVPGSPDFNGHISRAPNRSRLVLVGEKNRNGGHDFIPRTAPEYRKNVQTNYRVSRDGKAYYLFGDYHIESIEGDQSTQAHPEYDSYDPSNRLYYRW